MSDLPLAVRSLVAGYGGVPVVHNLDLEVRAGEVAVLLGPNGAGKTTTLLTIAGELPPIAGTVELFGKPAAGSLDRRVRQGMAFLPEERGVFRRLSVTDNLRMGPGSVADGFALAPELVRLRRRRAGLLSGGEQQILALARALAAGPRIVIADELSLGLAPLVVERMLATVRRVANEGAAVLLVEQHVRLALSIADHGYVLRRGALELAGTVADLYSRIDEIDDAYLSADDMGVTAPARAGSPKVEG